MSELIFPLHIRPGNPGDIGAMALTWERALLGPDSEQLPTRPNPSRRRLVALHFKDPETWSFVAPAGDAIAGFVLGAPLVAPQIIHAEQTEHLAQLMVDTVHWGHGLGAALLSAAAERAYARGKQYMSLWTPESNDRARGLYERHGFEPTHEEFIHSHFGLMMRYVALLPCNF
jgi:ribosomal protein S18 acetylase RimI-like enzyme